LVTCGQDGSLGDEGVAAVEMAQRVHQSADGQAGGVLDGGQDDEGLCPDGQRLPHDLVRWRRVKADHHLWGAVDLGSQSIKNEDDEAVALAETSSRCRSWEAVGEVTVDASSLDDVLDPGRLFVLGRDHDGEVPPIGDVERLEDVEQLVELGPLVWLRERERSGREAIDLGQSSGHWILVAPPSEGRSNVEAPELVVGQVLADGVRSDGESQQLARVLGDDEVGQGPRTVLGEVVEVLLRHRRGHLDEIEGLGKVHLLIWLLERN